MNYEDCTLVELRQYAKEKGIKGYSKLKREELINSLNNENFDSNLEIQILEAINYELNFFTAYDILSFLLNNEILFILKIEWYY